MVALEEDQNCPLSLQMTGQSTGRSPTPCERDDRCTNTVHGKRPRNTSKSKPLVGILLRCCEDADKNKSTVSIDGTAGRFIRKIRRTVKRLNQKDIPEHKARGDPREQKNSLKNWSRQSVIQLSSPARKQEVHQLQDGKHFPGDGKSVFRQKALAEETAQGDKKVSAQQKHEDPCLHPSNHVKAGCGHTHL